MILSTVFSPPLDEVNPALTSPAQGQLDADKKSHTTGKTGVTIYSQTAISPGHLIPSSKSVFSCQCTPSLP